ITKRNSRKRKRIQQGGTMERLVVVVIKKAPNWPYGAVGTVERLGITLERTKWIKKNLLNLIQVRRTRVLCLIVIKMMVIEMGW
ncbi:hypothetical protein P154DRAFT_426342, partial [Amniculicola lignicola CBS 123094]